MIEMCEKLDKSNSQLKCRCVIYIISKVGDHNRW